MTLKIEPGKYYRDAEGNKVGPIVSGTNFCWSKGKCRLADPVWNHDGTNRYQACIDLVAEWPDHPTVWRDMTEAEQGALLLAHHQGKVIEYCLPTYGSDWTVDTSPLWDLDFAYRVRLEPKAKTATLRPAQNLRKLGIVGAWVTRTPEQITPGTYTHPDGHTIIVEE